MQNVEQNVGKAVNGVTQKIIKLEKLQQAIFFEELLKEAGYEEVS